MYPMCYTEACNCTGNTSNTSPTDMNHCCSGGLNGVSFSDANGICSPCPGDCHSTTADCTGTIMANGMGVSERRCCSTLGGTSFDVNGQCFECTGGVYCGQDPHFAVPLSDGQLLCYSVQGLAYFAFNLISDPTININAYFIPPEKKEDFKEYATFLGDIGIMIQPNNCEGKCKTEDITKITISASDRSVLLDGSRTVLSDRPVHVMVDNTTATIQLGEKLKKGEHPNMIVSVKKPTLSFKVNFVNEHLDLAVMDDNGISDGCHGIMGQFLRREPEIENGVLRLNGRQIETEEKAAWDFLRTEKMCLHAKPLYGYQAEGIIEGKYTDYIVESIFSPHFQYSKFKL
ncbi:inter-alpha-trypsin inhibitor heavy chain H5-like isoform X2 [Dysidea avara]|uniref:inter-alpha-trypsin inhibitor heavy chain H5-like isoform X2 n=1 Tax=Dysidea avara TaxID=196820 RepID=UPI0033272AD8